MNETWKGMKYADGQCSVLLRMLLFATTNPLPNPLTLFSRHSPVHSSSIPLSRSDTASFPIPRPRPLFPRLLLGESEVGPREKPDS